jgi:hypothetical protein
MKTKHQNIVNAGKLARHAVSLVTLVAAGLSTPYVQADILPAINGHAWIAGDQGCFNSSWAQVWNGCFEQKKYLIPVPIRRSGNSALRVRVYLDPQSSNRFVRCRAVVNDSSNGLVGQNDPPVEAIAGGFHTLDLGTFNVPVWATLHFDCDLGGSNSSSIISVNWIQS